MPTPRCAPGITITKLDPNDWILDSIVPLAPCPMDIIAITEPIPITIPRTVRPDLALLTNSAEYVSSNKSEIIMIGLPARPGRDACFYFSYPQQSHHP